MRFNGFFSVFVLLAVFLTPVWSENLRVAQASGDKLAAVLTNIETTNKKMTGLKATIAHQHTNTQLGIKDPEQIGTLFYKPGTARRVKIDYSKPSKVVAVTGDRAILFERELNQVFLSTVSKFTSKSASYGLLSVLNSASQLRDKFNIVLVGNETFEGQATSHLTLTPKTAESSYTRIEVWVDQKNWLPVRQIFYERNQDYTEVKLKNVEFNPSNLGDKEFEVDYRGAKVIKQ